MTCSQRKNETIKKTSKLSIKIDPLFFCFSGTIIDIQWNLYKLKQSDSRGHSWFKSNTKFQEQIQKNENDCTVHGVRHERETKQRIGFKIDFRLVWMMFTFFRVMLSKSEDFMCICSIAQFPDWMYLFIFFLWSFDHRHFNFIHSGMIFTLLFSSRWEWSGIRFGLQTALYIYVPRRTVPCH